MIPPDTVKDVEVNAPPPPPPPPVLPLSLMPTLPSLFHPHSSSPSLSLPLLFSFCPSLPPYSSLLSLCIQLPGNYSKVDRHKPIRQNKKVKLVSVCKDAERYVAKP